MLDMGTEEKVGRGRARHDTIEDLGMCECQGEPLRRYYARILANIAKLADILHNMECLPEADQVRLKKKYKFALDVLNERAI